MENAYKSRAVVDLHLVALIRMEAVVDHILTIIQATLANIYRMRLHYGVLFRNLARMTKRRAIILRSFFLLIGLKRNKKLKWMFRKGIGMGHLGKIQFLD